MLADVHFFIGSRCGGNGVPGCRDYSCYTCGCSVALSPSGQKRMDWDTAGHPYVLCLDCAESRAANEDGTTVAVIEVGRDDRHRREMFAEIVMAGARNRN